MKSINSTFLKYANDFVLFVIGTGAAKSTARSYRYDILLFLKFLHTIPNFSESKKEIEINKLIIVGFIGWLTEKNYMRSTIQRRVMGVLAFWEFLYEEKLTKNPPMTLKTMRLKIHPNPNPTHPLSHREFKQFTEGLSDELAAIY